MNDIITAATSGLFVEVGKVIEHMKAQQARIAELEAQIAAAPAPVAGAQWKSLNDVQWMNIVNHDHAYFGWDKEDAVHHAVKATEAKLRELNATPKPADTDKVREALKLAIRQNSCDMLMTGEEIRKCEAALNSMAAQAPVHEVPGYKLVPVEPTQEMLKAGVKAFQHTWNAGEDNLDDWRANYRAMLAAAPLPAAPVQQEGASNG